MAPGQTLPPGSTKPQRRRLTIALHVARRTPPMPRPLLFRVPYRRKSAAQTCSPWHAQTVLCSTRNLRYRCSVVKSHRQENRQKCWPTPSPAAYRRDGLDYQPQAGAKRLRLQPVQMHTADDTLIYFWAAKSSAKRMYPDVSPDWSRPIHQPPRHRRSTAPRRPHPRCPARCRPAAHRSDAPWLQTSPYPPCS